MTTLILEQVKNNLGILPDNLGFDSELLVYINSVAAMLVQLGISDMDIEIDESTEWPVFDSPKVGRLVKMYIPLKLKRWFDPTTSETISTSIQATTTELEGRISNENEDYLDSLV